MYRWSWPQGQPLFSWFNTYLNPHFNLEALVALLVHLIQFPFPNFQRASFQNSQCHCCNIYACIMGTGCLRERSWTIFLLLDRLFRSLCTRQQKLSPDARLSPTQCKWKKGLGEKGAWGQLKFELEIRSSLGVGTRIKPLSDGFQLPNWQFVRIQLESFMNLRDAK